LELLAYLEAEQARSRTVLEESNAAKARSRAAAARAEAARVRADAVLDRARAVVGRAQLLAAALKPAAEPPTLHQLYPPDLVSQAWFLGTEAVRRRNEVADMADRVAVEADTFATILEKSAARGDRKRREGWARIERQVAGIERRNAIKLRTSPSDWLHLELEKLPSLAGFTEDTDELVGPPLRDAAPLPGPERGALPPNG
jgi:hypothetical protein